MAIKIFIDQGHNPSGHNLGASVGNIFEQDITYNVGLFLAALLRLDGRFDAALSRSLPSEVLGEDTAGSLAARVYMANTWPADYFLSIHANANVNPGINGTEMYVYSQNGEAYPLAQNILTAIVATVGTRNNLVRLNPALYVLKNTNMPAVLVELAYMTNPSDLNLLLTKQFEFAKGIYIGLLTYFGL